MAKPEESSLGLILFNDSALRKSRAKEGDAFELEAKLRPIYEAILSKGTDTPFSIMFSGGWGTGKTSAMRWMDEHLREAGDGKDQRIRIDTCWFYPWKYQNQEDVWKGLIAEVIMASIDFEKVDTNKVLMAAKQFGRFLGGSFVRVLSGLKFGVEGGTDPKAKVEFAVKDALTGIIEEYGKHVTPQEAYYNVFERAVEEWIGACYKEGESRLVIFIDDLDRCLPGIALQVLEAIKLYLNVPNLIVVVGVDRQVIDAVVRKHYKDSLGDAFAGEMAAKARQYLDKMFQVEVPVSPREAQVKDYINEQLPRSPIWAKISDAHQKIFQHIIEEIADINPRSVIRALNTAIVGAESETDELKVSQAMQRALITTVLQRLPESEYGSVFDLCLREEGLEFFRKWSETVLANPNQPLYLLPSELPNSTGARRIEPTSTATELVDKVTLGTVKPSDRPLRDLAHEEVKFQKLLTVRTLGLLMRIPFPPTRSVTWAEVRAIVAEEQRVAIDQVTREYLETLDVLNLDDTLVSDEGLKNLEGLIGLGTLSLNSTQISDEGLKSLKGLTGLGTLSLNSTQISDEGLKNLKGLTGLRTLSLDSTQVTDEGLRNLKGLTGLRTLSLNSTQVTDEGLKSLEGMTGMTSLSLISTGVTDEGLKSLERMTGMTSLWLISTKVTDKGLKSLEGMTGITSLWLNNMQVTDKGLKSLEGMTSMTSLWLNNTQVTDKGLKSLEGMTGMTSLSLESAQVTDEGLKSLEGMIKLVYLWLGRTQVTDEGLKSLEGMTGLVYLWLINTQTTEEGLAAFKAKLPKCRVVR